jgi:nucleotide-binding universal stress UspA family protein
MYEHIVAGVANTERSMAALDQALQLAAKLGASLEIVTAFDDRGSDAEIASARKHAEGLIERLAATSKVETRTHALPGDAAAAILQVAAEVGADLVIVGNKGMQGVRRVLGSVPNDVAHKADCSVLIVDTAP